MSTKAEREMVKVNFVSDTSLDMYPPGFYSWEDWGWRHDRMIHAASEASVDKYDKRDRVGIEAMKKEDR